MGRKRENMGRKRETHACHVIFSREIGRSEKIRHFQMSFMFIIFPRVNKSNHHH